MAEFYQKYRAEAADPVLTDVIEYLDHLDIETTQPLEFQSGPFAYYSSSQDHVLNAEDSNKFCGLWGGKLLTITNEEELQAVTKHFRGRSTWYGKENPEYGYKFFEGHQPTTDTTLGNTTACYVVNFSEEKYEFVDCART
jgi:hypothetical protein